MVENERTYVVPLRKDVLKKARWKRAKRAVSTLRNFIKRHMKTDIVKISKEVNEFIWQFGGKRVPSKVKVVAKKQKDVVEVTLAGVKKQSKKQKKEKKKEEKKSEKK
ncbi:MAG: 60S ribosomal protein L31 [Nanoarchaeota archaeon]|nr:60S ribosomal protein L31 [Nanoarchaeota archaeon]